MSLQTKPGMTDQPKPDEEEKPIFTAKELSNAWYRQVREKYGPVTEYHRLNFGQLK